MAVPKSEDEEMPIDVQTDAAEQPTTEGTAPEVVTNEQENNE